MPIAPQLGVSLGSSAVSSPSRGVDEKPIRVALVQDHALVRAGLRMLLESRGRFQVVGEAEGTIAARAMVAACDPDVIVLDADHGSEVRLGLIPRLLTKSPTPARLLLLTQIEDPEAHHRAIRLGAVGVVLKKAPVDAFLKAIERIHAGEVWLSRTIVASLVQEWRHPAGVSVPTAAKAPASLSPREREVIGLVCQGLRNEQIARRLFISPATVRHHLTSVFAKLNIAGRYALIARAHEYGVSSSAGDPASAASRA